MNPSLVTVIFLLLLAVYQVIHFAYFHKVFPEETSCEDVPQGSIVLALGFEHLGEVNGMIDPGEANLEIVKQLEKCVDRFSLILTQKAVSDAMLKLGIMEGDTFHSVQVQQMHEHHPERNIRTQQALRLAIQQLSPPPAHLVLLAHDKQIERAMLDLRMVYQGNIILWRHNGYPYAQQGFLQPLLWSFREIFVARPIEGIQRIFCRK